MTLAGARAASEALRPSRAMTSGAHVVRQVRAERDGGVAVHRCPPSRSERRPRKRHLCMDDTLTCASDRWLEGRRRGRDAGRSRAPVAAVGV